MRKKTAIIAGLAALGFLAVGVGPVLADELPPGMPDIKGKPVVGKASPAHLHSMRYGTRQMHGQMMRGQMMQAHQMSMRGMQDADEAVGMPHMSGGGC